MTPVRIKRNLRAEMLKRLYTFVLEFGENRVTDFDETEMVIGSLERTIPFVESLPGKQMHFSATFYFKDPEHAAEFKLRFC